MLIDLALIIGGLALGAVNGAILVRKRRRMSRTLAGVSVVLAATAVAAGAVSMWIGSS